MISKCQIQKYICQIELEISDGICSTYTGSRVEYYGMLYGIKIAEGIKKYPIKSGAIKINDEFKRGLLRGLRMVLFCDKKRNETTKERYENGEEALIASYYEDQCVSNYVDVFKHKLEARRISEMKTKEEVMDIIKNITNAINLGIYSHDERQFERGRIKGMLSVFDDDGADVYNKANLKVNIKFELDKAAYKQFIADMTAYKQFIADMKEIEAEMKLDNNINIAGEYLEYGDVVHKKSDGKFYKSDVSENTMTSERSAEITAELDGLIRVGALDPKTVGHIPATLKDVCEWWIKTYPEHSAYHKLKGKDMLIDSRFDIVRTHMEKLLKSIK